MEIALIAAGFVVGIGLGFILFRRGRAAPEPPSITDATDEAPVEARVQTDEPAPGADDGEETPNLENELEQLQQRSRGLVARVDELELTVRRYRRWAGIQLQRLTEGLEGAWQEAGLQSRVHEPGNARNEGQLTKIHNLAETMREWMDEIEIGTPEAWYRLGLCWALEGRHEEASRAFQEATHQGMGRDASLALADSLWELGRPKAAGRFYEEIMRTDSAPEHVRFRLATTAVGEGRNEDGLMALAPLLKRRRNPEDVSILACTALTRLERFDDAVKACEKGLRQHKKSARLMASMMIPLGHLEDSDGRLEETYQSAVELDSELAEVPYAMGLARLNADDDEGAESYLEEALILDEDHAEAHQHLGTIYNRRGEFATALTSFQRAVEIKPDYAEAFYHMKDAYEGLRDFENAIAVLNRAVQLRPDLE